MVPTQWKSGFRRFYNKGSYRIDRLLSQKPSNDLAKRTNELTLSGPRSSNKREHRPENLRLALRVDVVGHQAAGRTYVICESNGANSPAFDSWELYLEIGRQMSDRSSDGRALAKFHGNSIMHRDGG